MKCRRIKLDNISGTRNIVWFGSYGKNQDGSAKFYNDKNKHDNYSDGKEAVSDSLVQRLNVLQGELWYNMNDGFPLWDNYKSTIVFDAYIASVILSHPDVNSIINFDSDIINDNAQLIYKASIQVDTVYGQIDISNNRVL